jgi:hypothetical protein
VAAETSNTAVETSLGVPFPTDVEAMAELIATETASSDKIGETPIDEPSSAQTQTPPPAVGEPEAQAPAASIEMTVVEMVSVAPVEMEASGEPELSAQVEVVSVAVMSIESTDQKPSSEGEQPELIRPNPPLRIKSKLLNRRPNPSRRMYPAKITRHLEAESKR